MNNYPDPRKPISVAGLKSATKEDIRDKIEFYKGKGYRVEHRTHLANGKKLPYNGVLIIDRRRKYLL